MPTYSYFGCTVNYYLETIVIRSNCVPLKILRRAVLVGFEVLIAASVKSMVFWVVMPCSSEKVRRFGGTRNYAALPHGRKYS
jgi:hypothetical protein